MCIHGGIEMIKNYPDAADISDIVSSQMPFGNVRDFYKKRGIIYVTNSREKIALYCSRIFLGSRDYEEMKTFIKTQRNFKRISGFQLETENDLEEIENILKNKRGEILDEKTKLMIKDIVAHGDGSLTGTLNYESKKIGKTELLRTDDRKINFKIEENIERKIVLTYHEKNEDHAMIINAIEYISRDLGDSEKLLPHKPTLKRLIVPQRIELFDRLLQHDYEDWRVENVVSIKIRKGEEMEDEEIPDKDLIGINQALLSGDNLRTNRIVKRFEKNGYYFSGITIKLIHKTDPIKILVEVFFKSKPEFAEIKINDSYEVTDGEESKNILPEYEQKRYLKNFWDILLQIYFGIVDQKIPPSI
jgi:hypothetical protein